MNPLNPIERAKTIGEGNEPCRSRPGPIVYLEHMQYALCHAAPGLRYSPQRPIQPKTDVCRKRGEDSYSKNLCTIRGLIDETGGGEGRREDARCLLGSNVDRTPFTSLGSYPAFR